MRREPVYRRRRRVAALAIVAVAFWAGVSWSHTLQQSVQRQVQHIEQGG